MRKQHGYWKDERNLLKEIEKVREKNQGKFPSIYQLKKQGDWEVYYAIRKYLNIELFRDTKGNSQSGQNNLERNLILIPDLKKYEENISPINQPSNKEIQEKIIQEILNNVSPGERKIISLRLKGLRYKEISKILNITFRSATVRYHQAIKKLRTNEYFQKRYQKLLRA